MGGKRPGGKRPGGKRHGGQKVGGQKVGGQKTGGQKTGGQKTGGQMSCHHWTHICGIDLLKGSLWKKASLDHEYLHNYP